MDLKFWQFLKNIVRPPKYDPKNPPLGMEATNLDSINRVNGVNRQIEDMHDRNRFRLISQQRKSK